MHPVRVFRFVLSGLLLIFAVFAGVQGYWPALLTGLFGAGFAALMAISVKGSRAEAEAAIRAGGGWRRLDPPMSPFLDIVLALAAIFAGWTAFVVAQPA